MAQNTSDVNTTVGTPGSANVHDLGTPEQSNNTIVAGNSTVIEIVNDLPTTDAIAKTEFLRLRQERINWLIAHNYPPLPVVPLQDANKYYLWDDKKQSPKRDKNGNYLPKFPGKCPSFFDSNGEPQLISYGEYFDKLPDNATIDKWFASPDVGVGTLGKWHNTVWIDFDLKNFSDQQACDRAVNEWVAKFPQVNNFVERTHSGGWRFGVRVVTPPTFTNFTLSPGSGLVGEAIYKRFTVLAPTIGVSGNAYVSISAGELPEVESLTAIGIYPTKEEKDAKAKTTTKKHEKVTAPVSVSTEYGSLNLLALASKNVTDIILGGEREVSDRSDTITTVANELLGWLNWSNQNGVSIIDDHEALCIQAAKNVGLFDENRVSRILGTISFNSVYPACEKYGLKKVWEKVKYLNEEMYQGLCPDAIKAEIDGETGEIKTENMTQKQKDALADDDDLMDIALKSGNKDFTACIQGLALNYFNGDNTKSEVDSELVAISKNFYIPINTIEKIFKERVSQLKREDNILTSIKDVQNILNSPTSITLDGIAHEALRERLDDLSNKSGVSQIAIYTTIMACCASLTNPNTYLHGTSYDLHGKPILYICHVAAPGTAKSPSQGKALKPFLELDNEFVNEYREKLKWYEADMEEWEKNRKANGKQISLEAYEQINPRPHAPLLKVIYTSDSTPEALVEKLANNKDCGILIGVDELVDAFDIGRYGKSASKGRTVLLSGRDGVGFSVNRKGSKLPITSTNTSMSIVGGIQPKVLSEFMGNFEDKDGLISRFFMFGLDYKRNVFEIDDFNPIYSLKDEIKQIYRVAISQKHKVYKMSREARTLFKKWNDLLNDDKMDSSKSTYERSLFAKSVRFTLDAALCIHIVNNACNIINLKKISDIGIFDSFTESIDDIPEIVTEETVKAAMKLVQESIRFTFNFAKMNNPNGTGNTATSISDVYKNIISRFPAGSVITAREAQRLCTSKEIRNSSCEEIRMYFKGLAQQGYGELIGKLGKESLKRLDP